MNSKIQLIILAIVAQLAAVKLADALTVEEIDGLIVKGDHNEEELDRLRGWFEESRHHEHVMVVLDNMARMVAHVDESNLCTEANYKLILPSYYTYINLPSILAHRTLSLANDFDRACIKKVEDALSSKVSPKDVKKLTAFGVLVDEMKKNQAAGSNAFKLSKLFGKKLDNREIKREFEKVRPACESYVDALKDILVPDFKLRIISTTPDKTIDLAKKTKETCELFLSGGSS